MQSSQTYWTKSRKPREDNWVPKRKSCSFYQELEARKAADLNVNVDPEVLVTTNAEELNVNSGTFRNLFPENLSKNTEKCGFSKLRKVQNAALAYIDAGYTVYLATTARSGKTVGYMLPLIQKVSEDLKSRKHVDRVPRAIITTYCMEETKYVYETLLGLVPDTNINVALYNGQTDGESINEKDRADILVTTITWAIKLLNEQWMSLEYLKFFVVDSTNEQLSSRNAEAEGITRRMFRLYDQQAKNAQLILVSADVSALDCPFWKERSEISEKWVVLKNEQRISPSNHLLVRVREKDMPHAVCEAIKSWDKGQVLVVVHAHLDDFMIRCQQIQKHLERYGVPAVFYHTKLSMSEKDAILNDFITLKERVLIMKYSYPTRVIRAPNIKQVIHVSIPSFLGEQNSASYHFSSGAVSFVSNARSVVLLNVDDRKEHYGRKLGRLTDCIQDCTSVVDWPHNYIPPWAAKYQGQWALKEWDESDKEGLEDLPDLTAGSQEKQKDSYKQRPERFSSKSNEDKSNDEGFSQQPNETSESRVPRRFEGYSDNSEHQPVSRCQKEVQNDWESTGSTRYSEDPRLDQWLIDQQRYCRQEKNGSRDICESQGPPRQYQQEQFHNDYSDGRCQRAPQRCCEPKQNYHSGTGCNECQKNRYNPNQQQTRYNEYEQPLCQNMQRMKMSEAQGYQFQNIRNEVQQSNFSGPSQEPMRGLAQGGCEQCRCAPMNQSSQYADRNEYRDNCYQLPMKQNATGGCRDRTSYGTIYRNSQYEKQQGSYSQQLMERSDCRQQCCRPAPIVQNASYRQGDGQRGNAHRGNDGYQKQNSPRNSNSVPNIVPGNRFAHLRNPGSQKETFENRPASGNRQERNQGSLNRW